MTIYQQAAQAAADYAADHTDPAKAVAVARTILNEGGATDYQISINRPSMVGQPARVIVTTNGEMRGYASAWTTR